MEKVTIFHEYGAPTHYNALIELLDRNGIEHEFREMNFMSNFKSGIRHLSLSQIVKGFKNLFFYYSLPYLPKRKIVIGIAPFNKKLRYLSKAMTKHDVYYHTSYTCWDGSICAHDWHGDKAILDIWRRFLNSQVKHIFSVSQRTKTELLKNNYSREDKISVVNHSYITLPKVAKTHTLDNTFITVCALSHHKGVEEILEYFKNHPNCTLYIAGRGELLPLVQRYEHDYKNIIYLGYIKDQSKLFEYYRKVSFFILNSKKTASWEELFGMVLIESSANGLVPVASGHSGPREIITDGKDGFLFEEGDLDKALDKCLDLTQEQYDSLRANSINNGQKYYYKNMADRWKAILD